MLFCGTLKSRWMSARLDSLTVRIGFSRGATRLCMRTKPYQRRIDSCLRSGAAFSSMRRSTLMGWWMVPTTGKSFWMPSRPYPSVWLSCTTSKSP